MVFGVIYVQFSRKFWFSEAIFEVIFPLFVLTFSQNFPLRTQAQKQS